jgi:hypothetical protein
LHPDLIRVWVHPRIKSEDMLFGIVLEPDDEAGLSSPIRLG